MGCAISRKRVGAAGFAWQPLKIGLQVYRVSRHLQDHQSVEGCDAAIAAHVPSRVEGAAAGCNNLECDHGVYGGECWVFGSRGAWDWLGLEWIKLRFTPQPASSPAPERPKFRETVTEFVEQIRALDPSPLRDAAE